MIDIIMNIGGIVSELLGLVIELVLFALFTITLVVSLGIGSLYLIYLFG